MLLCLVGSDPTGSCVFGAPCTLQTLSLAPTCLQPRLVHSPATRRLRRRQSLALGKADCRRVVQAGTRVTGSPSATATLSRWLPARVVRGADSKSIHEHIRTRAHRSSEPIERTWSSHRASHSSYRSDTAV